MEYTETERRILDMWPKFEDGEYVMYEDEFEFDGDAKTAYGFNFGIGGRVSICSDKGSHVRLPNGEHVKRPAPKVLDADGVEIKVGDTVWHKDGTMLRVDGFGGIEDGEAIVNVHVIRGAAPWMAVRSLSLTHVQSDSWERLENDATMSAWSYRDKYGLAAGVSDGEYIPTTVAFALDLVRRAKALAEKEAAR